MRQDTDIGPVWLFPDMLPEKAAKHGARLDLMWPDLEGFIAMHMGPTRGGAWLVRAPTAALKALGLPTGSASEHPVAEGTVWPPLTEAEEDDLLREKHEVSSSLILWEYDTLVIMFGEEVAQAWLEYRLKEE